MGSIFEYYAINLENKNIFGLKCFDSLLDGEQWIHEQGWQLIYLKKQSIFSQIFRSLFTSKHQHAHLFFFYAHILLKQGMSIIHAMTWLHQLFPYEPMNEVVHDLQRGCALNIAFGRTSFAKDQWILIFLELTQKNSGNLSETFLKISTILKQQQQRKDTFMGEISKPLISLVGLFVSGFFFLMIIAPLSQTIWQESDRDLSELPLLIKTFFYMGSLSIWNIFIVLLMLCLLVCVCIHYRNIIKMLVFRKMKNWNHIYYVVNQGFYIDLFFKITWMLDNGFLFLQSFETLSHYVPEQHQEDFSQIVYKIHNGLPIHQAFLFYASGLKYHHIMLLKNGENNNCMGEMCQVITQLIEKDQEHLVNIITTITPILILLIWAGFFFALISIFSPIFDVILARIA